MKLKRLTAGFLTAAIVFTLVGCIAPNGGKTNGSDLTLWYEASTVKIIQDDKGEAVKTAKEKPTLTINMARNESEGVQMMMYAKKDISSFDVTVSDLVSANGIIPAEAVDIYLVKYIELDGNGVPSNPDLVSGALPDPLLPFDTAVEYNETAIKKGNNQSIYLDVTTDASTPAGVYTASVTVTTEEETYQMPMEVTVHDVTYPDTAELMTAFSYFDRDHFASAELDASDEQTTAYFETLLDYNMSSFFPFEGVGGTEKYTELVRKYYDYPGFSAYRLYYQVASAPYERDVATYNAALLKEYIKAIVEVSVEDHVNYLDKAYCYFYTVADEPREEAHFITAKKAIDIYDEMLRDADEEMRTQYAGTEDYEYYMSAVSDTVLHIPNVLPGYFDMEEVEYYGIENYTFVPLIDKLQTEADRNYYTEGRDDKVLWTYTCNQPVYPFPSGHIDDYSVAFRLATWMCFDYDFTGYLYWCVTDYLNLSGGEVKADPWETMDTGQYRPGEGKFFYPGEKYGLDHPCGSLRGMAWRDGVDDYSLLQAVEDIYNEYGLTADIALQDIFDRLYTGTIPTRDTYLFEDARNDVFALIRELKSDVGVLYADCDINFTDVHLALRTVNEDAIIEVDGKEATKDSEGNYIFDLKLTEQSSITFSVVCGEEEKEYTRTFVPGQLGVANGFEKTDDVDKLIFSSSTGYQASVNEEASFVKDGSKSVHLQMNKDKEDTLPYFAILNESDLIGGSYKNVKSLKFYVYNVGEEVDMNVSYYTTGETTITNITLKSGEWTPVEISMPQSVDDLDTISEIDFNFEQGSFVDLYIDSFTTIVGEE